MSDSTLPVNSGDTPPVEQGTVTTFSICYDMPPHYFEPVPRCYICDTPVALQTITVGKHAGQHICGGCLDGALRRVDGE